ncbi:hypothetical protein BT69DRAFT_662801 [Atractiella rhizophila]|nr:hypothetical protein BT69DRAFT_662801 [Atractiella rhizophila]
MQAEGEGTRRSPLLSYHSVPSIFVTLGLPLRNILLAMYLYSFPSSLLRANCTCPFITCAHPRYRLHSLRPPPCRACSVTSSPSISVRTTFITRSLGRVHQQKGTVGDSYGEEY